MEHELPIRMDGGVAEARPAVLVVPIQEINEGATIGTFAMRAIYTLRYQVDDGVPIVVGDEAKV